MQFDEKWSFVGKKEKHCDRDDPDDDLCGDCWDHVALDAEHRLVVSVVVGQRTEENSQRLVEDFQQRGRQVMADNIKYEIILYWSQEDQAFIAEVPELPVVSYEACRARSCFLR